VPRPVIENTSSTAIKNGFSVSLFGSGIQLSKASKSFLIAGTPTSAVSPSIKKLLEALDSWIPVVGMVILKKLILLKLTVKIHLLKFKEDAKKRSSLGSFFYLCCFIL
jgi:hypothetical protein